MITRSLGKLLVLALVPAAAAASTTPPTVLPASRIWIEGTSTVRSFTCKAPVFDIKLDGESDVLATPKAVHSLTVKVPSQKLDCGNATMNGHMQKAIKANEAPEISFKLSSYDLAAGGAGKTVKLTGTLSIGGVERPVTLNATAVPQGDGSVKVSGKQDVKLSDHGLKAPSLMMGTMKVGDVVKVGYEVVLK